MRQYNGDLLFSASDLVNFLACRSLTALDCVNLNSPLPAAEDGPMAKLLQDKGFAHESAFLKKLRAEGRKVVEIPSKLALEAALLESPWAGYADFLVRCETPSGLGSYGYEIYDTKLARQVSPRFLVQLGLYDSLLVGIQGRSGHKIHVVLGDNTVQSFIVSELDGYVAITKQRFLAHVAKLRGLSSLDQAWKNPAVPYPIRCDKCGTCRWAEICASKRVADDHLSQTANIRKSQIAKLEDAGVDTLVPWAKENNVSCARELVDEGGIQKLASRRKEHRDT